MNSKANALEYLKTLCYCMDRGKLSSTLYCVVKRSLIRTETIPLFFSRAFDIHNILLSKGWPSNYISGNQEQTKRLEAINYLKSMKIRVLISTDLVSLKGKMNENTMNSSSDNFT